MIYIKEDVEALYPEDFSFKELIGKFQPSLKSEYSLMGLLVPHFYGTLVSDKYFNYSTQENCGSRAINNFVYGNLKATLGFKGIFLGTQKALENYMKITNNNKFLEEYVFVELFFMSGSEITGEINRLEKRSSGETGNRSEWNTPMGGVEKFIYDKFSYFVDTGVVSSGRFNQRAEKLLGDLGRGGDECFLIVRRDSHVLAKVDIV
jgi:hypothetical protein